MRRFMAVVIASAFRNSLTKIWSLKRSRLKFCGERVFTVFVLDFDYVFSPPQGMTPPPDNPYPLN